MTTRPALISCGRRRHLAEAVRQLSVVSRLKLPIVQRRFAKRTAECQFSRVTMARPTWISIAKSAALRLRAETFGAGGARHSVYVILLHDPRGSGRWGLYVGQTSRDPDWRFDQHKAGYKASRAVKRFGVCLLPELVEHLNPMAEWESLEIEAALADAFRDSGVPWIEGGH